MVGGVIWTASWLLNSDTMDYGFAESRMRAILNPAILLYMVALWGFYERHRNHFGEMGTTGAAVSGIGLVVMLAGNIAAFGPLGEVSRSWQFDVFDLGMVWLAPIGLVIFGMAAIQAKVLPRWSRVLPMIMGLTVTLGALSSSVAFGLGNESVSDVVWPVMIFFLSFGLGWILLGYALWSDRRNQV